MLNVEKLLASKKVEVSYMDIDVDKDFVKEFRKRNHLTQVALANILGVRKKTIEKWEQGVNNINGSSAVLLKLLENNPELIQQLYSVRSNIEDFFAEDDYEVIDTKTITVVPKTSKVSSVKGNSFAAVF